jgi:hypothetical protein
MCEAVGYYDDASDNQFTIGLGWNGSTWIAQATVDPTGFLNQLSGVSCPAATDCEAVGTSLPAFRGQYSALMEVWNGSTWEQQSTSIAGLLNSVSCPSATDCEAVGVVGLAAVWDGTQWSVQSYPVPANGDSEVLYSVSCMGAKPCEAVAGYYESTTPLYLAERWGKLWKVQQAPTPVDAAFPYRLEGVSCVAFNFCEAVSGKIAERWNGSSWTLQS